MMTHFTTLPHKFPHLMSLRRGGKPCQASNGAKRDKLSPADRQ